GAKRDGAGSNVPAERVETGAGGAHNLLWRHARQRNCQLSGKSRRRVGAGGSVRAWHVERRQSGDSGEGSVTGMEKLVRPLWLDPHLLAPAGYMGVALCADRAAVGKAAQRLLV